jgi:hypothetical protein
MKNLAATRAALCALAASLVSLAACDASRTNGADGVDAAVCAVGMADCDSDGVCETDVRLPADCGGCGLVCPSGPHSTPTCSHGSCGLSCDAGWGDCDADPTNGCESDLTLPGTCGACGNSCGGACVAGACETCDDGLAIDTSDPLDAAHAIGLCAGVVSARWVMPDGSAPPTDPVLSARYHIGHGVLDDFGPNLAVREGHHLLAISSGAARRPDDPDFFSPSGYDKDYDANAPAGFPRPSAACPGVQGGDPHDAIALELELQAPDWAKGFAFDFDFYTYEWPMYVCSQYNDFFIALLSPIPTGQSDGDISYDPMGNPISVNAAFVNVCSCVGGPPCPAGGHPYTCSRGNAELMGTGFDEDSGHAATGWLTSTAPVEPGQTITLRLTIYDSADGILDSTALIDKFRWLPRSPVVTTEPIP